VLAASDPVAAWAASAAATATASRRPRSPAPRPTTPPPRLVEEQAGCRAQRPTEAEELATVVLERMGSAHVVNAATAPKASRSIAAAAGASDDL
jgi:hypothetical protein